MPTLSITKSYADGDILTEQDLDNIRTDVQTFVNTTKLDSSNIQAGGVATASIADLAVTTAKIASSAVTSAKIEDGAITLAKLATTIRMPPGMIAPYVGTSAPTGWLMCDGATVSRTTYADLFAIIGITHGQGDGSTTFHLPDYRGRFLRGVDGAQGRDPDRAARTAMNTGGNTGDAVGSVQNDEFKAHTHGYTHLEGGVSASDGQAGGNKVLTGLQTDSAGGSTETRPKNAFVNYIVKT